MAGRTTPKRRLRKAAKRKAPQSLPTVGFSQRGATSMLTPELRREICTKIATGDSLRDAALSCGVHEATAHEWIQRGKGTHKEREQTPEHVDFAEGVAQAVATRRRFLKGLIRRAAVGTPSKPGEWRAAQALGAMCDPKEFVPQVRVTVVAEHEAALDRIGKAFLPGDPAGYEKALQAIVGGTTGGGDDEEPASEPPHEPDEGGGE